MKTSQLVDGLKGSEIIKIAGEVNALKAAGEKIYNLTIGDFDPTIFPIPSLLKKYIIESYENNFTNYPNAAGEAVLRKEVSDYIRLKLGLDYKDSEFLIAGGARPIIYAIYETILDINDTVLYPAPSWNNDSYSYLARTKAIVLETKSENKFMPTAEEIAPYISEVNMIAVCSPLNPTGTTFTKDQLSAICDLIVLENKKRLEEDKKPVYLLYDQIYWQLTYGETKHYNPVSLNPEMRDYTLFVDGISKSFAATGVRVGWTFGPEAIVAKMKNVLNHVGAWAPKAEQLATAKFLQKPDEVEDYLSAIRSELEYRLNAFYEGFSNLKAEGLPVFAIQPEAALYLTVNFDLVGKTTANGEKLTTIKEVTAYLLNEAKVALVPFYAFGASDDNNWFRLSVGTVHKDEIPHIISQVKDALNRLK